MAETRLKLAKKSAYRMREAKPWDAPKYRGGRPTEYTPEVVKKCKWYADGGFSENGEVVPTKAGLALFLGVSHETLLEWSKDPNKKEFSVAWRLYGEASEKLLVKGALSGALNSPFSQFYAKAKLGWRDSDPETQKTPMIGVVILPAQASGQLEAGQILDASASVKAQVVELPETQS